MVDKLIWHQIWKAYESGHLAMGHTTLRNYMKVGILSAPLPQALCTSWHGKRFGMRRWGKS